MIALERELERHGLARLRAADRAARVDRRVEARECVDDAVRTCLARAPALVVGGVDGEGLGADRRRIECGPARDRACARAQVCARIAPARVAGEHGIAEPVCRPVRR